MIDKKLLIITFLVAFLSSCVIITREQQELLDNTAYLLEKRAELNDRAIELVGEDTEVYSGVIRLIDQNSELNRNTAGTIRNVIGK